MQDPFLIFSYPIWWLWIEAVIAAGLTWLLYSKKGRPWSPTINWILAGLRFTSLFLVMSLILHPLANLVTYEDEKPVLAIALDNSVSVALKSDTLRIFSAVEKLEEQAKTKGMEVALFNLNEQTELKDVRFDNKKTDLNQQIRTIEKTFQNKNLSAITLISDGIYNEGFSPANVTYLHPIFTIGLGDTIPPLDISIREINANNIVYQGNQFVAEVLLSANGYTDQNVSLRIVRNGETVAKENIVIQPQMSVSFELDADKAGLYRYTAMIDHMDGDVSATNDQLDFYVDIINGKENILIVAPSPHPDIRAIRTALGGSENYQTHLFIPGVSEVNTNESFDVVIYHQAFGRREVPLTNIGNLTKDAATFFLINSTPDPMRLANEAHITLEGYSRQTDQVTPSLVTSFSKFTIDEESSKAYSNYPSIAVPFAEYQLNGPHDVLLFQKVGSVSTQRPLLTYYDDGTNKMAIMMGTGIWKWRLQEAAITGKSENFDDLIRKTVQYLTVRNDKRKFRIAPTERIFEEGQLVSFRAEVYNDVYERIGSIPIAITITDASNSSRSYDYTSDASNDLLPLGTLSAGSYQFLATAMLPSEKLSVSGEFLVTRTQLEMIQQQANHNLLRQIATQTNGSFALLEDLESLEISFNQKEFRTIIRSYKEFVPLRHSIWLLCLVILLASAEWFLRKYLGGY